MTRSARRELAAGLAALALLVASGCRAAPRPAWSPEAASQTTLYFGLSRPGGTITPDEWADFLADTITPRFPAGLTVLEARGQWQEASGEILREPTRVVVIVHPPDAASDRALEEIRDEYRHRFQQEAVLRVDTPVQMGF